MRPTTWRHIQLDRETFFKHPFSKALTPIKTGWPSTHPTCELVKRAVTHVQVIGVYPLGSLGPDEQGKAVAGEEQKDGRLQIALAHTFFLPPTPHLSIQCFPTSETSPLSLRHSSRPAPEVRDTYSRCSSLFHSTKTLLAATLADPTRRSVNSNRIDLQETATSQDPNRVGLRHRDATPKYVSRQPARCLFGPAYLSDRHNRLRLASIGNLGPRPVALLLD